MRRIETLATNHQHIRHTQAADRLESAGVTQQQARGVTSALSEAMTVGTALKADLEDVRSDLKTEIADARSDLKADIADVRSDLKAEIADVRSELKAEILEVRSELKSEIAAVRSDGLVLKWMTGFLLALVVAIFVKLFVH